MAIMTLVNPILAIPLKANAIMRVIKIMSKIIKLLQLKLNPAKNNTLSGVVVNNNSNNG